jgi:hypothetical protein
MGKAGNTSSGSSSERTATSSARVQEADNHSGSAQASDWRWAQRAEGTGNSEHSRPSDNCSSYAESPVCPDSADTSAAC